MAVDDLVLSSNPLRYALHTRRLLTRTGWQRRSTANVLRRMAFSGTDEA